VKHWFRTFSVLLLALAASPSYAAAGDDALIEGAKLCTAHLPRYERAYAIPTHLLSAIASTESGRYHEGLKLRLPWPWTINVEGKGYYFDTKAQAVAAVQKYRARGIQSIDVGCMQVNLMHHPDAFASLDQAFEPESNIAYAAGFLRGLYNEEGTWKKAAADYHSKTPKFGNEYAGMVYESWFNIIDKLRAAKLHVPESAIADMNAMKTETPMKLANLSPASGRPAPKVIETAYHPHMNHIQVVDSDSTAQASAPSTVTSHKEKSVMVIRPEIVTADSTPTDTAPKVIRVNDAQTTTARKAGPNFIFND